MLLDQESYPSTDHRTEQSTKYRAKYPSISFYPVYISPVSIITVIEQVVWSETIKTIVNGGDPSINYVKTRGTSI